MPIIQLEDGTLVNDHDEIARELNPLSIHFRHFDPGTALLFPDLHHRDTLADKEKQNILELHNCHLEFLMQEKNYIWHDLLVLHPGSPNLHMIATNYYKYHTHTTPEALYVLAGEAIYGFVLPDGSQMRLLVQPQDYIHIPEGVEHWFSLGASLHLKAVRYFTTASGWLPCYTNTLLKDSFAQG